MYLLVIITETAADDLVLERLPLVLRSVEELDGVLSPT